MCRTVALIFLVFQWTSTDEREAPTILISPGQQENGVRISHRTWPAVLAFGLPPGAGFARAPAGIGLPEHAIPLAFLFSDLGVESGRRISIGAFFQAVVSAAEAATVRLGPTHPCMASA